MIALRILSLVGFVLAVLAMFVLLALVGGRTIRWSFDGHPHSFSLTIDK